VLEYELVIEVVISVMEVQPDPWHLYILYPATPTLSVEAVHERLIWDEDMAVAVKSDGTEGAVVSGAWPIVTAAPFHVPTI